MKRNKTQCEICGRLISNSNIKRHILSHQNETQPKPEPCRLDHDDLFCKFCNKEYKNKNSLAQHEIRCPSNPNRKDFDKLGKYVTKNFKGHTKEDNKSIQKCSRTLKEKYKSGEIVVWSKGKPGTFLGKTHSDKTKRLISKAMLGNHNNNPELFGTTSKKGWYHGIFCASTYELAFVVYMLDHGIPVIRCPYKYNYEYEGKQHLYYPDFLIENTIYEIKGFWTELVDIKAAAVTDRDIYVLYEEDLQDVFDYIKNTYNKTIHKNIDDLYEIKYIPKTSTSDNKK